MSSSNSAPAKRGFNVPFVFAGTLFVVIVLALGITACVSITLSQALAFARTSPREVLNDANSTLGNLTQNLGEAVRGMGSVLTNVSSDYANHLLNSLVASFKENMIDQPVRSMQSPLQEYMRTGRNLTTFADAIPLMWQLWGKLFTARQIAFVIDGGYDGRYETLTKDGGFVRYTTIDGKFTPLFKRPLQVGFAYQPIFYRETLGWEPGVMGMLAIVSKANLAEFLLLSGPNADQHARRSDSWGVTWRVVNSSDEHWQLATAIADNVTHRNLFAIDDPLVTSVLVKQFAYTGNQSIIPDTVCDIRFAVGGGACWGDGLDDTKNLDMRAESLRDPNFRNIKHFTNSCPYRFLGFQWFYQGITLYPTTLDPDLPRHPGLDNVLDAPGVDLGRVYISILADDIPSYLREVTSAAPFTSLYAILHNSIGHEIATSNLRQKVLGKVMWTLDMAVAGDSSSTDLAYALMVEHVHGGYSSLRSMAQSKERICIPGRLMLAADAFHATYKRNPALGNFISVFDPQYAHHWVVNGTSLMTLPCGEAVSRDWHPNDTYMYLAEIHDSSRAYDNTSVVIPYTDQWLEREIPPEFVGTRYGQPCFNSSLIIAMAVSFQELSRHIAQSRVEIDDAELNATVSIADQRIQAVSNLESAEAQLTYTVIGIVFGVSIMLMVIAAFLFHRSVSPLRYVLLSLQSVEEFDLTGGTESLSKMVTLFTEFQQTRDGVASMISRLADYRRYLPEWLVARENGEEEGGSLSHAARHSKSHSIAELPALVPSRRGSRVEIALSTRMKTGGRSHRSKNMSDTAEETAGKPNISASSFEKKDIAVLFLNLPSRENERNLNNRATRINACLYAAEPIVRRFRGSMSPELVSSTTDNLSLVILFNAQMPCRSVVTAALDCAVALEEPLKSIYTSRSQPADDADAATMACGVYFTSTVVGSVGTDNQRWYVTMGSIGHMSRAMSIIARSISAHIVCNGTTFERTSVEQASFRHLEVLPMKYTHHNEASTMIEPIVVSSRLEQNDDEWMYMLESAGDKLQDANSAENLFAKVMRAFVDSAERPVAISTLQGLVSSAASSASSEDAPKVASSIRRLSSLYERILAAAKESGKTEFSWAPGSVAAYCVDLFGPTHDLSDAASALVADLDQEA